MAKTCLMCGKPSGMYALCMSCIKLKKEEKIVKCSDCGQWHYTNEECMCKINNSSENINKKIIDKNKHFNTNDYVSNIQGNCIVCGKYAPNGSLCKECYYEMKGYQDEFDKNAKVYELKDYYFNLKSNIYRMLKFETVQTNCNKMMAIAVLVKELHKDSSLIDRALSDIKDIIEKKKPKEIVQKISEYTEKQDSQKETILRTQDGHIVKSKGEVDVDDALYNLRIVHCYDKKVSEISNAERTLNCDWFIPVLSNSQGIYVEYWGMKTKDYLKNKSEKQKLYKDNNIPLIEVEKDDVNDKQGLADRIRMEANECAEKYFKTKNRF